jgi:hypothetical protein
MTAARLKDLCLDANDPEALADWWSRVLGYRRAGAEEGGGRPPGKPVLLLPGPDGGPPLWVNPVPEPKTAKNRLHMDLYGDTAEILAAGAELLPENVGSGWDVLADPEGNEFCVFPPPA